MNEAWLFVSHLLCSVRCGGHCSGLKLKLKPEESEIKTRRE